METCIPRHIVVGPKSETISGLAALFGSLAEPARLLIVQTLSMYGDTCTCEIASALKLSQPTITHHLKILEKAGIVNRKPRGKWTYFGLSGERVGDIILLAHSMSESAKVPSIPEGGAMFPIRTRNTSVTAARP